MAKFDQRGQKVKNQVNAESIGAVSFNTVNNNAEFVAELWKLLSEIKKASQADLITDDIAVEVESHIKKAVIEIEKPEQKKKAILDHIQSAKSLLEGITSATDFVTALIQAAKIANDFFL